MQATELDVLEFEPIQPLRTEQVSIEGCGIASRKSMSQTITSRRSEVRCSKPYYIGGRGKEGEKSSVLKYLLQDPEFGKSRGRIKVA